MLLSPSSPPPPPGVSTPWWRRAVIYQVYLRSFADGNGDGIGDLAGLRSRLAYLDGLGVDALWLNPWYRSPMADGGYDVADYRDIDPSFGTLADAIALVDDVHRLGMRLIVDLVPNHCSVEHPWFAEALAAGPGSLERDRFWFRSGRGPGGEEPPNDWTSHFGGPAWTRVTERDGRAGDWYLHLFSPEQPDLNWDNPGVRAEFEEVLRFWMDWGVDGFRIDTADLLVKDAALPDQGVQPDGCASPFCDRDEVHDIYRTWRQITDRYQPPRVLVGEIWVPDPERFARYLRPDELHQAFNFALLRCAWEAKALRDVIDQTLASHDRVDAPPTWVLSNHDVTRHVTRYGRADTSFDFGDRKHGAPVDLELGTRRARAAALLVMALPGSLYLYQGEELGLWEVEDIPDQCRKDPVFARSGGSDRGRDGCRVPIPWGSAEPPYDFCPAEATAPPWLPQTADWARYTVEAQDDDPDSMLSLYRSALQLRRTHPALGDGTLRWLTRDEHDEPDVLAFARQGAATGADPDGAAVSLVCLVNLSDRSIRLPHHDRVLLASGPLEGGRLPADTAVWLDVS